MCWMDVAGIVFVCVTMNHLGLIAAIEESMGKKLRIVSCPKCATFWSVLAYCAVCCHDIISTFATSFLASYAAIWLELFEGYIDTLYNKAYGKIYSAADNADAGAADTDGTVSDV